jgi:hypothetical protein
MSAPANIEVAFDKMAEAAAENVSSGDLLGLGSGSAVARFSKALGRRIKSEAIKVSIVPSSMQSYLLARENNLELAIVRCSHRRSGSDFPFHKVHDKRRRRGIAQRKNSDFGF